MRGIKSTCVDLKIYVKVLISFDINGQILMIQKNEYLMENNEEAIRLDLKTNSAVVEKRAIWAGIKPGMRVADICFGSGKTTAILNKLVQPKGSVIGIDGSEMRMEYARKTYAAEGIEFKVKDIREPLIDLGMFDFVWVRFVLEYYRAENFEIVKNISSIVKPGGILCLIDLDQNCLNHYGMPQRLEKTLFSLIKALEEKADFDPFAGRKLYSFLYDLDYTNIDIDLTAHHLIFGELNDTDAFNWLKKVEVAPKKINYKFEEYNGYEEFLNEFRAFFTNPKRFTYTPVISCKGIKPKS